jgi:alkyl hydroperoxide reductase subunit AhpF
MAQRHFDCEGCGAHGKITFRESDEFRRADVAYCPFCGGDIYEDEEYTDDEEDQ